MGINSTNMPPKIRRTMTPRMTSHRNRSMSILMRDSGVAPTKERFQEVSGGTTQVQDPALKVNGTSLGGYGTPNERPSW